MLLWVFIGVCAAGAMCAASTVLYLKSTVKMLEGRGSAGGTAEAVDAGCFRAYGTIEGEDSVLTCIVFDREEGPSCEALRGAWVAFIDGGTGRVRVQRLSQYPSGRVVCEAVVDGGRAPVP